MGNARSRRHKALDADLYPNGLPSICLLHTVAWELILPLLSLPDVLKLLSLGNPLLAANVSHGVQIIRWRHPGPFVDLNRFMAFCHHFKRTEDGASWLKEIMIEAIEPRMVVKKPLKSLDFPSSLSSLSLHFAEAFTVISPLNLSELLPQLLFLSIKAVQSSPFDLEGIQLPQNLKSLTYSSEDFSPPITPNWIPSLPHTLESLSLHGIIGFRDAEIADLSKCFKWPPALTHLTLSDSGEIRIEHLPRHVTSLDLIKAKLATGFPKLEEKFIFPWRRFFPYLCRLKLPQLSNRALRLHGGLFLRSLVLDDALEASSVDLFVTSGFWDVASLRHLQTVEGRAKELYPLFRELFVHRHNYQDIPRTLLASELEALFPLLKSADLGYIPIGNKEELPYLVATSRLDILAPLGPSASTEPLLLPPSVTAIFVVVMYEAELPPQLLEITCASYRRQTSLPPRLTSLSIVTDLATPELLNLLPTTLTQLVVMIDTPESWTLIAERLFNLRILKVTFDSGWKCEGPMSRISSQQLEKVRIRAVDTNDTLNKPRLVELFCSEPFPVFPASLRTLKIKGHLSAWHSSILGVLPMSLTSFSVDQLAWPDTNGEMEHPSLNKTPYPGTKGLNSEALLKRLPPALRSLRLGYDRCPEEPKFKYLPPTVTTLILPAPYAMSLNQEKAVPPYLYQGGKNTINISPSIIRPSGFLN